MKYINYLYEKANGATIFFTFGAITALISYVIFYSLIVTDPSSKLTTSNISIVSLVFGILGGLLFLTSILATRNLQNSGITRKLLRNKLMQLILKNSLNTSIKVNLKF